MRQKPTIPILNLLGILGIVSFFLFSFFLMTKTFSVDHKSHEISMSSHLWSDFGAHIPLIRSFSFGNNWPPEYPLFPGEKIRYHFLFYALVGLGERIGIPLDWSLNSLSIIGFFGFGVGIFLLGKRIFQSSAVGILGVLFFLFNGTLSFLRFFGSHPVSLHTITDIVTATKFPSFGPWDGGWVTAFWNLNVYTNQRHLAFSFALVLIALISLFYLPQKETKKTERLFLKLFPIPKIRVLIPHALGIGLIAGTLLYLNQPALLVLGVYFLYFFVCKPQARTILLLAGLITVPFVLLFPTIAQPAGRPVWEPGFLTPKPATVFTFLLFWIHNLGIHIVLIPLGILLSPKELRRFALPLAILFLLPNLFRFSTDMINNHKILNFFFAIGNLYSAYAIVFIYRMIAKRMKLLAIVFVIPVILLSILSGIIDFFVVINDYPLIFQDLPANEAALFVKEHIPPRAIVLNSTWFYDPASIAGRPIFNGYSFFTWSAGYDTYKREAVVKDIFHATDFTTACPLLLKNHIGYVEVSKQADDYLKPISPLWTTTVPALYTTKDRVIRFIEVGKICEK